MIWSTSDVVVLQIGRVLISGDESTSRYCSYCMSNTNVSSLHRFRVLGALAGFPTHHLTLADSPHCEVTYGPVKDITVCCGVLVRSSVAFFSVSLRRSTVSFSRSFTCESLNTFTMCTMVSHPCRCVIGSHVSSFLSYPSHQTLQGTLHFVITNLSAKILTRCVAPEPGSSLVFLYFCQVHPYHRSCRIRWVWNSSF